MRKEQMVRGRVTPQAHQVLTLHQIPKAERQGIVHANQESWWTAYCNPSAPRRDDFAAEVERRHRERLDTSKPKYVKAPKVVEKKAPAIEQAACDVCGTTFQRNPNWVPLRRFCSHKCNSKAWKARQKSA